MESKKWYLKEIVLKKNNYKPSDMDYTCKVTFINEQYESFNINLSKEKMEKYLSFIMDDINANFASIQNDFMDSLKNNNDK